MYEVDFLSVMGPMIVAYVILLLLCVFLIFANCRLFAKAGESWWKAIIPYYNTFVMTQLAGMKVVWFVLYLIPCTMFIASFVITYDLLKSYGCSTGMAIAGVFLPFIIIPLVAFSNKYQYIGVGE